MNMKKFVIAAIAVTCFMISSTYSAEPAQRETELEKREREMKLISTMADVVRADKHINPKGEDYFGYERTRACNLGTCAYVFQYEWIPYWNPDTCQTERLLRYEYGNPEDVPPIGIGCPIRICWRGE